MYELIISYSAMMNAVKIEEAIVDGGLHGSHELLLVRREVSFRYNE